MNTFIHKHTRKLTTLIIVFLFSTCLWQLASAGWIQGKAIVAQQLLNHSWHKTRLDFSRQQESLSYKSQTYKPWPWADTWPVAKLIVPQYDIEQIVLAGDSGSSLAFAPGLSFAGAEPNTIGTTMISGHRDTHFQFLKDIKVNDTLTLQTYDKSLRYKVDKLEVVDSRSFKLAYDEDEKNLVLVTCYPFDTLSAGGTERYLVYVSAI
jgi:sortase A